MLNNSISNVVKRISPNSARLVLKTNPNHPHHYRCYFIKHFSSNAEDLEKQRRSLTNVDIQEFKRILSNEERRIILSNNKEKNQLDQYNTDWTKHYKGNSKVVLKPKTTQEILDIVSYCYNNKICIVPQGGNTGLVGGSIPTHQEIIINLEKMNKITAFDSNTGVLSCEAGCVIHSLQEYVKEYNYLLPIDLGSKGSCNIGGVVSTNAGGQYYYRYGSIHSNLLGLEVLVTSKDGAKVLNLLNTNLKNNTGYHLKNLFVGSEGTLGIITKVILKCPTHPKSKQCIMLSCNKRKNPFENIINIVQEAKKQLNEILAALEYMDMKVMNVVLQQQASNQTMFDAFKDGNFILLLETHGSNSDHDVEKLELFLSYIMECGYIDDAILARNEVQSQQMWNVRESCNPSVQALGYTYKYDISIPTDKFYDITQDLDQTIKQHTNTPSYIITSWGHILDGNLHLNVTTPNIHKQNTYFEELVSNCIYDTILNQKYDNRNCSISAEHGIGQLKRKYLSNVHSKDVLDTFYDLKDVFDSRGIFNPGKVLP